jgi:hypothetical protein
LLLIFFISSARWGWGWGLIQSLQSTEFLYKWWVQVQECQVKYRPDNISPVYFILGPIKAKFDGLNLSWA